MSVPGSFQTWTATINPGQTLCLSIPMDGLEDAKITNASLGPQLSDATEGSRSTLLFKFIPDTDDSTLLVPLTTLIPYRHEQTELDILLPKGYVYELHCRGDNAIGVVGHCPRGEASVFFRDSRDEETTPQPPEQARTEVVNEVAKTEAAAKGSQAKGKGKAPKNSTKRRKTESTTEAVAPTTPIQYTRKRGSQPQIGLNEGYIVKYTLQVRMGDNGTKSTIENQINIDDSKTHKGQQKFLMPFLIGLGAGGCKKITVPSNLLHQVKGCGFGRLADGQPCIIDLTVTDVLEGSK
ncbi:hypothetical protein EV121DRAFT_296898 [Schizophyllum commune]